MNPLIISIYFRILAKLAARRNDRRLDAQWSFGDARELEIWRDKLDVSN